jgi:hypothetical protein
MFGDSTEGILFSVLFVDEGFVNIRVVGSGRGWWGKCLFLVAFLS